MDLKGDRQKIVARIRSLALNPRPHGSEKLAGCADRYRVRQGNFRFIYLIDDAEIEITIYKIGDRKDVYRQAA